MKVQNYMNSVLLVIVNLPVTGYLKFPKLTLKVVAYQSKAILTSFFTVSCNQISLTEVISLSQIQELLMMVDDTGLSFLCKVYRYWY